MENNAQNRSRIYDSKRKNAHQCEKFGDKMGETVRNVHIWHLAQIK